MTQPKFSMTFDVRSVDEWVDAMQADVQQALRPAAQAGAQVFYNQVLANVPQGRKGHWFHGTSFRVKGKRYWFDAGSLKRAVYQAYATKESTPLRPVYSVGVNPRKAAYAWMVEFGTVKTQPVKYIARAELKRAQAIDAVEAEFRKRLKMF